MILDAAGLARFYATPLGRRAAAVIRRRLARSLGSASGRRIAVIGFAPPQIADWCARAQVAVQLNPARIGALRGGWRAVLSAEDALPLADEAVDVLVLIHALEAAGDADALLREIWRVLAPEGRLVAIVARRTGLWALSAATPFGHGRPWRAGEIAALMADRCFTVLESARILRFPPFGARVLPALAIERLADALALPLGGLLFVTAAKRLARPVLEGRRGPALRPVHVWQRVPTKAANGSIHCARGSRKESWPSSVSA